MNIQIGFLIITLILVAGFIGVDAFAYGAYEAAYDFTYGSMYTVPCDIIPMILDANYAKEQNEGVRGTTDALELISVEKCGTITTPIEAIEEIVEKETIGQYNLQFIQDEDRYISHYEMMTELIIGADFECEEIVPAVDFAFRNNEYEESVDFAGIDALIDWSVTNCALEIDYELHRVMFLSKQ